MKDKWQGYAVAVLTSLMLGGGGSYLISSSRINAVEANMEKKIEDLDDKLEAEQMNDVESQLRIIEGLVRLEEQVKYIRERLDRQ